MRENRKGWSKKEDQCLIGLVKTYGREWGNISEQINLIFKHQRGPQQCKQRYLNNFDPSVNRSCWTQDQIRKLFQEYRKHGSQWIRISQNLQTGRTDIAIKNQFYSAIRRSLRRINKFLGGNNSTQTVNNIKPKQLTNLLKNLQQSSLKQDQQHLYQILFDFSDDTKYEELKDKANNKIYKQKLQRIISQARKTQKQKQPQSSITHQKKTKYNNHTQQQKQQKNIKKQQNQSQNSSLQQPSQRMQQTHEQQKKKKNMFKQQLQQSMQMSQQNQEQDEQNKNKLDKQLHHIIKYQQDQMNEQPFLHTRQQNSLNRMLENSDNYKPTKQVPINIVPLSQSGSYGIEYQIKLMTNSINSLHISSNSQEQNNNNKNGVN